MLKNSTVRQVTVPAGAGFVATLTEAIMKMPVLLKVPAVEKLMLIKIE